MDQPVSPTPVVGVLTTTVAVLALGLVGAGAYSVHEYRAARSASQQNAVISESLKNTNAQVEALTAKLNDLTAPKPAPEVHEARPAPPRARKAVVHRQAVDPRWKKLQAQVDEQGKAIESARQDLNNARTELTGSIARTHDELVVLQRKGERNYVEFDIDKSKQFSHQGPVGVKLKKANVKHQYADLELIVDDATLTKKHVNLYEPATFYAADSDQPIQLVINKITKNHIHGYVSAPKYARSDLNVASEGSSKSTMQPDNSLAARPRQQLAVPQ